MRARLRIRVHRGVFRVEHDSARLDRQFAAGRHRVPGVYDEVDQRLLELTGIGFDPAEVVSQRNFERDVFAYDALQQAFDFDDRVVDAHALKLDDLSSAETQQAPGELRRARGGASNLS